MKLNKKFNLCPPKTKLKNLKKNRTEEIKINLDKHMEIVLTIIAFILSLVIVVISVPPIVRVSKAKNLFDSFNERKVHTQIIPPLGGVAIFLGFVLSTIIATDGLTFNVLKYIIASVIIMFFIGLKDDLIDISARKKFIVQVFAAILLITLGNVHVSNLHGIFGLHEISSVSGIFFSLFIMLAIINAFNLVDGIDGLASGLALMASVVFGTWFFIAGHIQFAIMSFALAGSLAGFFLFNVFGNRNKLFMGDTGSLVIGLVISTLVIKFNEYNIVKSLPYAIGAAPAVSFAVLTVPLLDTLRVITIRLMNGKSPFAPDRNHTHHRLLEMIPSHFKVTAIMVSGNAAVVGIALWFNHIGFNVNLQFLLVFCIGVLICLIPSTILRIKKMRSGSKHFILKTK